MTIKNTSKTTIKTKEKKTDIAFKYAILASGSSGNATYIETEKHHILVDDGLTAKKMEEALESIGRSASEIDSLFLTHEHADHVKGVGILARKYPQIAIYANEPTWRELLSKNTLGKINREQIRSFELGATKTFDDIDVESFGVSHDAVAPQFYRFMKDEKSFVVLTDTGYVSERMAGTISDADVYLMESNYHPELLRLAPYPWRTKQRILSDTGHLSNEEGAQAILDVIGRHTKKIFLGHRSEHSNTLQAAHEMMRTSLQQHDVDTERSVQVLDTKHGEASPLYNL